MRGVQLAQALAGYVGINLCCRNISMAQQHLDHPQVGAMIEQMRGKSMPEHMRRKGGIDAGHGSIFFYDKPECLARHRAAATCDEQCLTASRPEQGDASPGHILLNPVLGFRAHGHKAILAAFSQSDAHYAFGQTDMQYIKADQFGDSEACGIERFQHGAIPQAQGRGHVRSEQKRLDLLFRQGVRKASGLFCGSQPQAWVFVDVPLSHGPTIITAQCSKAAICRTGACGFMGCCKPGLDVGSRSLKQGPPMCRFHPLSKRGQVPPVC